MQMWQKKIDLMQSSILLHKIVELDLEPPHLYGRQKAQAILGRK